MGLSVMENAPNMEQQLRYANNVGQGMYIAPEHWLGEANMGQLGLEDMRGGQAGLGEGGQITNAVSSGIQSLAQAIIGAQNAKRAAKASAPARGKPNPQQAEMQAGEHHGGGGGGGWFDGGPKTWGLVAAGALLLFLLFFAFSKKKGGGGEHHHEGGL